MSQEQEDSIITEFIEEISSGSRASRDSNDDTLESEKDKNGRDDDPIQDIMDHRLKEFDESPRDLLDDEVSPSNLDFMKLLRQPSGNDLQIERHAETLEDPLQFPQQLPGLNAFPPPTRGKKQPTHHGSQQRRKQWKIPQSQKQMDIPALTSYAGFVSLNIDDSTDEISNPPDLMSGQKKRGRPTRKIASSALSGQDAAAHHREYIAQLEQRNKEKRRQMELDDRQKMLRDREKGFNLYMGGANKQLAQDRARMNHMRRNQKLNRSPARGRKSQVSSALTSTGGSRSAPCSPPPERVNMVQEAVTPSTKFQQRRKEWKKERAPRIRGAIAPKKDVLISGREITSEEHKQENHTGADDDRFFEELFGDLDKTQTAPEGVPLATELVSKKERVGEIREPKESKEPPRNGADAENKRKSLGGLDLSQNDISFLRQSLSLIGLARNQIQEEQRLQPSPEEQHEEFSVLESGSPFLGQIIKRMNGLDRDKQEKLLEFLQQLEDESSDESVGQEEEIPCTSSHSSLHQHNQTDSQEVENQELSMESIEDDDPLRNISGNNITNTINDNINVDNEWLQIGLRLLSTWGHDRAVGLTEIELRGDRGQNIPIQEEDVTVKGGICADTNIMRLFNGKTHTTDENHMWQTVLPTLAYLELMIKVPKKEGLSSLKIWNFNKNINESIKGVKNMEVLINEEIVWRGQILRGCGNSVFDYSTTIPVKTATQEQEPVELDVRQLDSSLHEQMIERVNNPELFESDEESNSDNVVTSNRPTPSSINAALTKDLHSVRSIDVSNDGTIEDTPLDEVFPQVAQQKTKEKTHFHVNTLSESTKVPLWLNVGKNEMPTDTREPKAAEIGGSQTTLRVAGKNSRRGRILPDGYVSMNDNDKQIENVELKISPRDTNPQSLFEQARERRRQRPSSKSSARKTITPGDTPHEVGGSHIEFVDPLTLFRQQGEQQQQQQERQQQQKLESPVVKILPLQRHQSSPQFITPQRLQVEQQDHLDSFEVPLLPRGSRLAINIQTTWGDPHYVGLTGIEIFDSRGELVAIRDPKRQVRADPADINILPQYKNDPRTVDKLFDGHNRTCDDTHMWLAPFTIGRDHFIYIDLITPSAIGMLRFWNYNKSRIHSYRGARYIQIQLDDKTIFKGEIKRANGTLSNIEDQIDVCTYCVCFNVH